jgi:hypothetical protein
MEFREIQGIVLKVYTDELFKFSYLKFLTDTTLESIKIPSTLENFKMNHILNPNYMMSIEIIKTRKNWILKNVLEYNRISHPIKYIDFIKQVELTKITLSHIQEDQDVEIFDFVKTSVEQIHSLDLKEYEKKLLSLLGF